MFFHSVVLRWHRFIMAAIIKKMDEENKIHSRKQKDHVVNYSATSYRASETVSAPEGRSGIFFYSCLTG